MDKLFYFLYFVGMILCFFPSVFWVFLTLRTRWYMRWRLSHFPEERNALGYGRIGNHLRMLISAAEAGRLLPSVEVFCLFSGALTVGSFLCFGVIAPWHTSLLWSVLTGLTPYLFLQARLHEKRVQRSLEGDVLIQELLNHYRIYDYHILTALEITAASLDEAPLGKKLFLELAKDLQMAVTKEEVEAVLMEFRYAYDTVWGNTLASNIFFGHVYGVRVDGALQDMLSCMVQSRKAIEYGRRENHEAKIMLVWLSPICFVLSVVFACCFFDFTLYKFFSYQMGTALGLQWFFSIIFCYVVSLLVHRFLAKEKMDI